MPLRTGTWNLPAHTMHAMHMVHPKQHWRFLVVDLAMVTELQQVAG